MMNTLRRVLSAVLPYSPMEGGRERLNRQYERGTWEYLRGLGELSRFSVLAGYCRFLRPGGAILEIGCGDGILAERLSAGSYGQFLGVDISETAIARAQRLADARHRFVAADAATYVPDARFDLIVFNEVLEYFDDPLAVVQRYEAFLTDDGLLLASMFVGLDTVRTRKIWAMLERRYRTVDQTRVTNGNGYSWVQRVLEPVGRAARPPRG
jgi:SAM-dependent methyltransferase